MYSILDYAISFLIKKIANYKSALDSYVSVLLACHWFLYIVLRSVSSFKWGWKNTQPQQNRKTLFRKGSKHKPGQQVVLTAIPFVILLHRFFCIIFLKANMLLVVLNSYLLFHWEKNKSNNRNLCWFYWRFPEPGFESGFTPIQHTKLCNLSGINLNLIQMKYTLEMFSLFTRSCLTNQQYV